MNIIKTFRKWSAYRVTVRELNALDDRTLNDLGISRGDIRPLARDYAARV
jgi:uncharacterized protein YjiS (DUF1127 family)